MGYVASVIQPGEKITFNGKIHWVVYFWPITFALIGIDLILLGPAQMSFVYDKPIDGGPPFFLLFGVCFTALGLVNFIGVLFYTLTTEIVVTNRRVIFKKGFIWRKTMEMNLAKVESVYIDQTVIGRILDYGTVAIIGTGSSIEPFTSVDSPIKLRNTIQSYEL
jgi:hypothetical protein